MAKTPMGFASIIGFDSTKLLYTFVKTDTSATAYDRGGWTATQDCFVVGYIIHNYPTMQNTTAYVSVDGVYAGDTASFITGATDTYSGVCIPVKKGQSVVVQTKKDQIFRIKAYEPLY